MNWVYETENKIYSRVNGILLSQFRSRYSGFNVTLDNALPTKAKIPSVYIAFLGASERGQTLDGTSINAVNMTVEVHVKTTFDDDQGVRLNREIAYAVTDAFKTMGFMATMPTIPTSNIDGIYESVSRYERIIGMDDVLYSI